MINAEKLELYSKNKIFKGHIDKYKSYNTIRRDLRLAYDICNKIINVQQEIKKDINFIYKVRENLYLYRASMLYAVILYSRWFKSTNNKPTLNVEKYLDKNDIIYHNQIINLRDKYIAHNENDILGGDDVFIKYDNNKQICHVESTFQEEIFLQRDELNLEHLRICIQNVHNKIDSDDIPKLERKIIKFCKNNPHENYNSTIK